MLALAVGVNGSRHHRAELPPLEFKEPPGLRRAGRLGASSLAIRVAGFLRLRGKSEMKEIGEESGTGPRETAGSMCVAAGLPGLHLTALAGLEVMR